MAHVRLICQTQVIAVHIIIQSNNRSGWYSNSLPSKQHLPDGNLPVSLLGSWNSICDLRNTNWHHLNTCRWSWVSVVVALGRINLWNDRILTQRRHNAMALGYKRRSYAAEKRRHLEEPGIAEEKSSKILVSDRFHFSKISRDSLERRQQRPHTSYC